MSWEDHGGFVAIKKVLNREIIFYKKEACLDWDQDSSMHHGYYAPESC